MSWGSIAWDLNHKFANHNGGQRTRQVVWQFAAADQKAFVSRVLKIPRDLNDKATSQGFDLNGLLAGAVTAALKKVKA